MLYEVITGADNVGLNEFRRPFDTAIDMGLGGKVDHRVDLLFGKELFNQSGVRNNFV